MLKWLQPGFAWGFTAAGGIILLYLLRRRHMPRGVPSTLLWQEVIREQEASHPFQKLKRHILLPIQLLALSALVLALMRPAMVPEKPAEVPTVPPADSQEEPLAWREADTTPVRIAVAGADSVFLETALKLRPSVTVLRTTTEEMASAEADLYVYVPETAAEAESGEDSARAPLVFSRTPGSPLLSWRTPENGEEGSLSLYGRSPLTEQITFRDTAVRTYVIPVGGKTAATVNGDPVIAYTAGEVMLGFDPQDSNLPMKYDFPILIQNILSYLMPETVSALSRETVEEGADPGEEPARAGEEAEQPRELGWIFALVFLGLLTLEYGVSRYVG